MSVTREDVIWAYRMLLGREPEDESVINRKVNMFSNREDLRFFIQNSLEFRLKSFSSILINPILVMLHVPKTAGTSIRTILRSRVSGPVFWHGEEGLLSDFHNKRMEWKLNSYDLIGGHFGIKDFDIYRSFVHRPVRFFSVVRDPVKRAVSLYRYIRDMKNHPQNHEVEGRTLYEALYLKGKFYDLCNNAQTLQILGSKKFNSESYLISDEEFIIVDMENLGKGLSDALGEGRIIEIPRINTGALGYQDQIEGQENFGKAVDLLVSANKEDYKLIDFVGGYFKSVRGS